MQGHVIIIEGLPGAGKSTLCRKYIEQYPNAVILLEEIDKELLALYLSDMTTYATMFQSHVQRTTFERMLEAIAQAHAGKTVLVDRGMIGNHCFISVQHDLGMIDDLSMALFDRLRGASSNFFDRGVMVKEFYLKTPTVVCKDRVRQRDNADAESYSLQYFNDLERYHDLYLMQATVLDGVVAVEELVQILHDTIKIQD